MDTIRIALSGQVYGTSGLIYTFPSSLAVQPHQPWVLELPEDARQEVRQVLRPGTESRCFAIWSTSEGYYYAALTPNEGGYTVVTVNTGQKVVSDGGLVQDMLEQLSDYFLSLPSAQLVESAHVAGAANALRQALMTAPEPVSNGVQTLAYRTENNELADVLQYACQAEYANFKRVYVVDEKVTNTQSNLQRIVTKIKKTYQVNCPEGAFASDLELVDGQKLTVTYKKEGYRDIQKSVLAGQDADFCTVEGCFIQVKPAEELGLKFMRAFSLKVMGDNGVEIPSFRIGQKVFTAGKAIGIPSKEMDLTISADGYEDGRVRLKPAEMKHDDVVEVTLRSQLTDIVLTINTGAETLSAPIKISGGSPLYHYLKGLNGKAVQAGGEAPAVGQGKGDEPKPKEPKPAEPDGSQRNDPPYIPPTPPVFPDHSKDEEKPEPTRGETDTKQFFVIVGIILTIILVVTGAIGYQLGWFGGKGEIQLVTGAQGDTLTTTELTDVEMEDADAEDQTIQPVSQYSYLDQHDVWKKAEATTPEEKQFIDLFQDQKVSYMLDTCQVTGSIQNAKFQQLVTAMKSVPRENRRSIARVFKAYSTGNVVDLSAMLAEMQKLASEYATPSASQQQKAAAAANNATVSSVD